MNLWWALAFDLWLASTALLTKRMLRRIMLREVCSGCGMTGSCDCGVRWEAGLPRKPDRVVYGSAFKRTRFDAWHAIWNASMWPVWVPPLVAFKVIRWFCRIVADIVLKRTPLTEPEWEAKVREQVVAIEENMKVINGKEVEQEPEPLKLLDIPNDAARRGPGPDSAFFR